uniref:Uncharacterized protein n=1 Tax=Trichuris muris TaxID=70415 RepID=A0A5S6QWM7_TRIMR
MCILEKCPPNTLFNFLKQECLNETLLVSSFRMFVSLVRYGRAIEYKPTGNIPSCVLPMLPDMVQYPVATAGRPTENLKRVAQHVRKMGMDNLHAARLLAIMVKDYPDISKLDLTEDSMVAKAYVGGISLLGLYDIVTGNRQPYTVSTEYMGDLLKGAKQPVGEACTEPVNPEDAFDSLAKAIARELKASVDPVRKSDF